MSTSRATVARDFLNAARAGALGVGLLIGAGCNSRSDAITEATSSTSSVSTFSFTLAPSSVTVSPGGSALSIATVRGAGGLPPTFVVGAAPNGVSVRVTSNTDGDGVTTKKVIIFTDSATPLGTYVVGIRVMASGRPDVEAGLTLVVAR